MEKEGSPYDIYNKGLVSDPEIAREMAEIEKPYRESKTLGIFPPTKNKLKEGEFLAEVKALELADQEFAKKLTLEDQLNAYKKLYLNRKYYYGFSAVYHDSPDIGFDSVSATKKAEELMLKMTDKEKEDYKLLIIVPKGLTSKVFQMFMDLPSNPGFRMDSSSKKLLDLGEESVAFARFSSEPDPETLGKNAKSANDWLETGKTFMNPIQMIVADNLYQILTTREITTDTFNSTSKNRFDQLCGTMYPQYKFLPQNYNNVTKEVVNYSWGDRDGKTRVGFVRADKSFPHIGVREIITEDIK